MQYFQSVNKIINFSHEAFHKDDLGQAYAQVSKLSWKRLQFTKIVELHGLLEIEEHVCQIWTFGSQLVKDIVRDQFDW